MSKNVKELTIKVEGKEWKDAIDAAFAKANKKVKIDGFSPGKAPKEVFLKKYGVEALYMDAADSALEAAYRKMFEDKILENAYNEYTKNYSNESFYRNYKRIYESK